MADYVFLRPIPDQVVNDSPNLAPCVQTLNLPVAKLE